MDKKVTFAGGSTGNNQQNELDKVFQKMSGEFNKDLTENQLKRVFSDIDQVTNELDSLLLNNVGVDGKIKRDRMAQVTNDLKKLRVRLAKQNEESFNRLINDSSNFALEGITDYFGYFEDPVLSPYAKLAQINENVVKYVARRFGDDGLILSDRIWNHAGNSIDAVSDVIRRGILTGQSVSEMVPLVRKEFKFQTTSNIKRLVITEGNTAYRTATAMGAEQSEVVQWVQLHHGRANNPKHNCNVLAAQDNYGEGDGVYTPSDKEIYNPHPNCTSFITFIVDEDYTLEGLQKRFGKLDDSEFEDAGTPGKVPDLSKATFPTLLSNEDASAMTDGKYGEFMRELTAEEKKSVKHYSGTGHMDMNRYLRQGILRDENNPMNTDIFDQIADIENVMANYELKNPIKVYRRMGRELEQMYNFEDLIGATINDKGFTSSMVIDDFIYNTRPIKWEIKIPAGKGRGAYIDELSQYKGHEAEFLIKKDGNYLITGMRDGVMPGEKIVEMELLTDE